MIDRRPRAHSDLVLGLLFGVTAVVGVLWAGGETSAWVSGNGLPKGRPLAGLLALAHGGDPSAAWDSPVGPAGIYWACTVLALAVAGSVAAGRLWRFDVGGRATTSPLRAEGLALPREVRQAAGARSLVARSAALRPSLHRRRASRRATSSAVSRLVGSASPSCSRLAGSLRR